VFGAVEESSNGWVARARQVCIGAVPLTSCDVEASGGGFVGSPSLAPMGRSVRRLAAHLGCHSRASAKLSSYFSKHKVLDPRSCRLGASFSRLVLGLAPRQPTRLAPRA
jgi:hypothetical protein